MKLAGTVHFRAGNKSAKAAHTSRPIELTMNLLVSSFQVPEIELQLSIQNCLANRQIIQLGARLSKVIKK